MKVKPLNHACFECAAIDILNQAYESFPQPVYIDCENAPKQAKQEKRLIEECEEQYDFYHSLYSCTIDFLERENLIFVREKSSHRYAEGVTLTSKGFLMLNEPAQLLEESRDPTIGESLKKAGKSIGSKVADQAIRTILAKLIT